MVEVDNVVVVSKLNIHPDDASFYAWALNMLCIYSTYIQGTVYMSTMCVCVCWR